MRICLTRLIHSQKIAAMHNATYAAPIAMTNTISSASARALLLSTLIGFVILTLIWGVRGVT